MQAAIPEDNNRQFIGWLQDFDVIVRDDNYWMGIALREARKAADRGEVPIGALVVRDGAGRKPWYILKTLTTYPFRPFKSQTTCIAGGLRKAPKRG
jgi:hypothetical protein